MSFKGYADKEWHRYSMLLVAINFLDIIFYLAGVQGNQRYLRMLRPVYLLGRNRDLRKVFTVLVDMVPMLARIYAIIFMYVIFFCIIGVIAFASYYSGTFGPANLQVEWVSLR